VHQPTLDDVFLTLTGSRAAEEPRPERRFSRNREEHEPREEHEHHEVPGVAAYPTEGRSAAHRRRRLRAGWIVDYLTIGKRNLLRYVRLPNLLVTSTVQPIMLVLLFTYVFGGVMKLEVHDYLDFLMPGVFVQAVVFGSTQTGIALSQDLASGMVQRFRSLPIARSAVLAGRTLSDVVRNVGVVLLITAVGFLIGFRIRGGPMAMLASLGVLVCFGLAFSWVSALVGLLAGDVESSQAASFVWVLPLTFASSAFLPVRLLPGWLQAFAKADPVTHTVDALRGLVNGGPVASQISDTFAWLAGILAVVVPLAVARYRRAV